MHLPGGREVKQHTMDARAGKKRGRFIHRMQSTRTLPPHGPSVRTRSTFNFQRFSRYPNDDFFSHNDMWKNKRKKLLLLLAYPHGVVAVMCTCCTFVVKNSLFWQRYRWAVARMYPVLSVGRTILTCSLPVRNTAHPYSGIKTFEWQSQRVL